MIKPSIDLQELRRRIYRRAKAEKTWRFWGLYVHVCKIETLRAAYQEAKANDGAPGLDGVSFEEIESQGVEEFLENIRQELLARNYKPTKNRRVEIPKGGGKTRKLGILTIKDRVVQGAVKLILEPIFEADFYESSFGYRPKRSAHQALDRVVHGLVQGLTQVIDVDLKGYFDAIDHEWLVRFLEHRIGDRRILRLVRKWLRAGISEEGEWSKTTVGSPQGSVISPFLSNVYLHYVFDLWMERWRRNRCRGDVVVVRYGDDFVIGFESHSEARACLEELRTRFAKFGLKLHEGKTRLIEFGRYAIERRAGRGESRPETFDFLGFTHKCAKTRRQCRFTILRHTVAKRMRTTLQAIKVELRKRMHWPMGETARWLGRVVRGWLNYHAVPGNSCRIGRFVDEVTRLWLQVLRRRSQRGRSRWTWGRMQRLARRYLPRPHIVHPYPDQRFRVRLEARAV